MAEEREEGPIKKRIKAALIGATTGLALEEVALAIDRLSQPRETQATTFALQVREFHRDQLTPRENNTIPAYDNLRNYLTTILNKTEGRTIPEERKAKYLDLSKIIPKLRLNEQQDSAFRKIAGDFFGIVSGTEQEVDSQILNGIMSLVRMGIVEPLSVLDETAIALILKHSTLEERALIRAINLSRGIRHVTQTPPAQHTQEHKLVEQFAQLIPFHLGQIGTHIAQAERAYDASVAQTKAALTKEFNEQIIEAEDVDATPEDIALAAEALNIPNLTTDELIMAALIYTYLHPDKQQPIVYLVGNMHVFDTTSAIENQKPTNQKPGLFRRLIHRGQQAA